MSSSRDGRWPVTPEEELLRAQAYGLLARLLSRPPSADLLSSVAALEGDDSEIGGAVAALAATARRVTAPLVEEEYHALFTGTDTGTGTGEAELVPCASYYLTGFLNELPLEHVRADMARIGILRVPRADALPEPEDHIAALCEMMSGLILGAYGEPADLRTQQHFFDAHIAPWAPRFFQDLEAAKAAVFYMPVGTLGRSFLSVESQAFALAA